jgi:NDP-sugar pyrophosphorylase family protein
MCELPDLNKVAVAILAGGLGTRLRSVTGQTPKALAVVAGRPFVAYLLDQLAAAGIARTVICTGHGGEQIEARLGGVFGDMQLRYSRESAPLGTGGALRLALPLFKSDWILALNGDSFAEVDLRAFWKWHQEQRALASLVVSRASDADRYGSVAIGGRGEVLSFSEKNQPRAPGLVNAGVYILNRSVIEAIPPGRAVSLEREILPEQIGKGFYAFQGCRRFLDIGTPDSYARAEEFFGFPQPMRLI